MPIMAVCHQQALTLQEANKALLAIREKHKGVEHQADQSLDQDVGLLANIDSLPFHLGWGSASVTAVFRTTQTRREQLKATADTSHWINRLQDNTQLDFHPLKNSKPTPDYPKTIKIHHDLAITMLKQNLAAPGRIWLLLRLIDQQGRGWISINEAKHRLTNDASELRVCGWRQLRNLLAKGKGIFWIRDRERIWLHGVARAACALGLTRLSGMPVQLPVAALINSIGETKAHFYASLHSGRRKNNPISRATLEESTRVSKRTQLRYETITGIQKTRNVAIGERLNKESLEERAWKHGRSIFKFTDYKGMQGKPQRNYIAWRLPNSYRGSHELAPKGRLRKINQELKDLVNKRAQGNSRRMDSRVFFPDGAKAVEAYNGNIGKKQDHYWQCGQAQKRPSSLWGVITTNA